MCCYSKSGTNNPLLLIDGKLAVIEILFENNGKMYNMKYKKEEIITTANNGYKKL